jgi:hypothetical protein
MIELLAKRNAAEDQNGLAESLAARNSLSRTAAKDPPPPEAPAPADLLSPNPPMTT